MYVFLCMYVCLVLTCNNSKKGMEQPGYYVNCNPVMLLVYIGLGNQSRCRIHLDETAEPVSRDQILRREQGQGKFHFPCSADHSRMGNLARLILTFAI